MYTNRDASARTRILKARTLAVDSGNIQKHTAATNSAASVYNDTKIGKLLPCCEVSPASGLVLFTTVGTTTWTAPAGVTSVEYLLVGGGGGGGGSYDFGAGGGGGGGLVLTGRYTVNPGNIYTVVVGDGGVGGTGSGSGGGDTNGFNGSSSLFDSIICLGGGGGGGSLNDRTGTGGAIGNAGTFAAPTGGKGGRTIISADRGGGGGGGMGSAGTSSSGNAGAVGGVGIADSLSGFTVTYSAGGRGGNRGSNFNGTNGAENTGNGGGGAASPSSDGSSGGKGGSGIVVVKW